MPIKTAVAAYTGKEVFKHLIDDIYKSISSITKTKIKQWDTERKIDSLYRKIYKVNKVKTIWQVDKAVDLKSFYCDSHVIMNKKRTKVAQLTDFKTSDNILIQGIAGQGKSIFLRHLCVTELLNGQYIPLFLELRRIQKGNTLRDRIYIAFKNLGLTVNDEIFDILAASGKILLLLDAFDEVPDDDQLNILTEIEDLAATKENLRIVITSRPNNSINMSSQFRVVQLDNLIGNEYEKVIQKLTTDKKFANNIIMHVESHSAKIKELLCTPLMVTLLILSYKTYHQLPTQLSDFYDSLFQVLLRRHDGSKPGFTRERSCKLDDIQYRHIFETLCTIAKEARESTFNHNNMYIFSKKALLENRFRDNPEHFLNDIVKITCLILRDGDEYRFIHKSVQEYYSAAFIERKPDLWVRKFYEKVIHTNSHRRWEKELEFLSEIDSYRYNKYFMLPLILGLLNIKEDQLVKKCPKATIKNTKAILGETALGFREDDLISLRHNAGGIYRELFFHEIVGINYSSTIKALGFAKRASKTPNRRYPIESEMIKISTLMDKGHLKKEFISITNKVFQIIFKEAQDIVLSLKNEEKDDILQNLI